MKTSDLALATFACMKGYRVVEMTNAGERIFFDLDVPEDKADTLRDEFMFSECLTYFNVLSQMKSLIYQYKERRSH